MEQKNELTDMDEEYDFSDAEIVSFRDHTTVSEVKYLKEYELELTFSSGLTAIIDLSDELSGEIFEPLKDFVIFKQVYLNPGTGTIEWSNGADFAPEFLFELAKQQQHSHVA